MPEITETKVKTVKLSCLEIIEALCDKFDIHGHIDSVVLTSDASGQEIEISPIASSNGITIQVTEGAGTRPVTTPPIGEPATSIPAGPDLGEVKPVPCGQGHTPWTTQTPADWNTNKPVEDVAPESVNPTCMSCGRPCDPLNEQCDECGDPEQPTCYECGQDIEPFQDICEDCERRQEEELEEQEAELRQDLPIVDDGSDFGPVAEEETPVVADDDLPIVDEDPFEGNDNDLNERLGVDDLPVVDDE